MIDVVEMMAMESRKALHQGDYLKDGMYYCGKCHTPKQCKIKMFGKVAMPICRCECEEKRIKQEKLEMVEHDRIERINALRRAGIPKDMHGWTFENDNGISNELLKKAKRYSDAWDKMRDENMGIIFWGSVGNGKTYAAACIANRLIDDGVSVMMTSIPKLLNDLSGFRVEDKNEYIDSLNRYSLLVIDDLGAERGTEYALEKVYEVIDGRYTSGKPLIVTTNLPLEELKNPKNIEYDRIYSRVLEMCVPIKSVGPSIRPTLAKAKFVAVKSFLEGDNGK